MEDLQCQGYDQDFKQGGREKVDSLRRSGVEVESDDGLEDIDVQFK